MTCRTLIFYRLFRFARSGLSTIGPVDGVTDELYI
jgi:hypothetical protein